MADFPRALAPVLEHEGGWVHDPQDPGGETYRGIARRYHPSWSGWPIVDRARAAGQRPPSAELLPHVGRFYRDQFWNRFQGDRIPDQALADELLDQAVHLGVHRAVTHLQRALNAANKNQALWPDTVTDGQLGPATLELVHRAVGGGAARRIVRMMNCLQGCYYLDQMARFPVREKYQGWFERV